VNVRPFNGKFLQLPKEPT